MRCIVSVELVPKITRFVETCMHLYFVELVPEITRFVESCMHLYFSAGMCL
jgi:hypothetical protein